MHDWLYKNLPEPFQSGSTTLYFRLKYTSVLCQSIVSLTFDNVSECANAILTRIHDTDSLWLSGGGLVLNLVFKSSMVQPIFAQF